MKCYLCKNNFEVNDGYPKKDGRFLCRGCNTVNVRKYRAAHREKIYEISKRSLNKEGNRLKQYARLKVRWQIKTGQMIKLPCIECGEIKTEAHHEDYSKPLRVKWYCRLCHSQLHKFARRELAVV